ncbi:MAG: NAD(P)-dependent alcohol dehydrogenase [Gemmatimonadetes bacterium]|nr:NAD(P)-dependent alcohol dehydrogenase [Gemmatimonadota bacterium]
MKAILQNRYGAPGEVLALREVEVPAIKEDQVLVRVHGAAIHPGDWMVVTGRPYLVRPMFGLPAPKKKTPGFDVAGVVEAVGSGVTELQPGDEVFGQCGGSCAEYVAVSPDRLAFKPASLSFREAAACPLSGDTALRALRDAGQVRPGKKVLINGASGGVGTFAVQIAKSMGAEVTGVCSTRNAELVRSLGADHVVDYSREDFTRGDERYDFILDNVGNRSMAACRRVVAPGGRFVPNNGTSGGRWTGTLGRTLAALVLSAVVPRQGRPFVALGNQADLLVLKELLESGKVTPVIDRVYSLAEVPDAFRYLEEGHATGKVVIAIGD